MIKMGKTDMVEIPKCRNKNRHEEDIVLFRGGIIWVLERFEDYRERVSKAGGQMTSC